MAGQETTGSPIFRKAQIKKEIRDMNKESIKWSDRIPDTKVGEAFKGAKAAFSIYSKVKEFPYTVEYFGAEQFYNKLNSLTDEVHRIERYVNDEIHNRNMTDSTESADEILRELEKELGVSINVTPFNRVAMIGAFIKKIEPIKESEQILTRRKYGLLNNG